MGIPLKGSLMQYEFEHLPSVNLVWHDPKLQQGSSSIVGTEEYFRLVTNTSDVKYELVCSLSVSNNSTVCVCLITSKTNVWQSQIENEYYSIAYFEHITKLDVL